MKFNNWELEGENGCWFDLEQTDAPHDFGADWWYAPHIVLYSSCVPVLKYHI